MGLNHEKLSCIHLRDKHPIIDAVGRLKDQNDKEWLLLIQVSLSTYSEHKSKAGDLQKQITWPESGVPVVHLDVLGWNTKKLFERDDS